MRNFFFGSLIGTVCFFGFFLLLDRDFLYGSGLVPYPLSQKEKRSILQTLDLYHKLLQDIYASQGDIMNLDLFPTSKWLRHEIFKDLYFLEKNNIVLVWDKVEEKVLDIKKISSQKVQLKVKESWSYQYQESLDRKPKGGVQGIVQTYLYTFIKKDDHWVVQNWEPWLSHE